MSKEEILDIMRSDFDANFRITLDNRVTRAVREYKLFGDPNARLMGVFELIAKSGQQYMFSVHKVPSIVSNNVYYGVATYFKLPTDLGMVYYTVTSEDPKDYYNFQPETSSVNRYTEHLINRYLERGNGKSRGEQGFVEMISENAYFDTKDIGDGKDGIYGVTTRGSIIGKVVNGKNCFNTFYNQSMVERGKFSEISKTIDIVAQREYMFVNMDINSVSRRYKTGKISAIDYATFVNAALQKVDDGFYEHIGKTKEQILQEVKDAIEEDAVRTTEALGSTHLQGRPQKLCVLSCLHRT